MIKKVCFDDIPGAQDQINDLTQLLASYSAIVPTYATIATLAQMIGIGIEIMSPDDSTEVEIIDIIAENIAYSRAKVRRRSAN